MENNEKNNNWMEWQAPELDFRGADSPWLWISVLVSLVFVAFSLWQQNFLFVVFIIVAEGTLFFIATSEKEEYRFALLEDGLKINNRLYLWNDFSFFSVDRGDGKNKKSYIYLSKNKTSSFNLRVPVFTEHLDKVSDFLNNYLAEREHEPSLLEELSKLLGF